MPLISAHRHPEEARAVSNPTRAALVHAFIVRVQHYTDEMLRKKWDELLQIDGEDGERLKKFSDWLVFKRFIQITRDEIESGKLDEWFEELV